MSEDTATIIFIQWITCSIVCGCLGNLWVCGACIAMAYFCLWVWCKFESKKEP